jgi:hypothetical protein
MPLEAKEPLASSMAMNWVRRKSQKKKKNSLDARWTLFISCHEPLLAFLHLSRANFQDQASASGTSAHKTGSKMDFRVSLEDVYDPNNSAVCWQGRSMTSWHSEICAYQTTWTLKSKSTEIKKGKEKVKGAADKSKNSAVIVYSFTPELPLQLQCSPYPYIGLVNAHSVSAYSVRKMCQ